MADPVAPEPILPSQAQPPGDGRPVPVSERLEIRAVGPALVYVSTAPRTAHLIDADGWDPTGMSLRERRLCRALLTHALDKLDALDKAEQMGLTIGKQETDRG